MTSPNTKKPKIYVETTLFNYYFDKDRDILHTNTVELFKQIAAGKYEAYTSDVVIKELGKAPEPKRTMMLDLIPEYGLTVLKPNDVAERLADIYIAEGIIPPTYRDDSLHIAIATVTGLDIIFSLNFRHIVKGRTIAETGKINLWHGFHAVELTPPTGRDEDENS